jgi:type IV pilus assembly protein PilN
MIRINLIPYREELRKKQIIEHVIVFVGVILVTVLFLAVVDAWKTAALTDMQQEKMSLQARNKALTKKIGELKDLDSLRKNVEKKLQIVDELQEGRFKTLVTLNKLAESIPESVWLTKLSEKKGSVSVAGFAESSQAVAAFMRALQEQDVFENITLVFDDVKKGEGSIARAFSLVFTRISLVGKQEGAKK